MNYRSEASRQFHQLAREGFMSGLKVTNLRTLKRMKVGWQACAVGAAAYQKGLRQDVGLSTDKAQEVLGLSLSPSFYTGVACGFGLRDEPSGRTTEDEQEGFEIGRNLWAEFGVADSAAVKSSSPTSV